MLDPPPLSPSLCVRVLFPQPPIQESREGRSPVLSSSSLADEFQLAVAENDPPPVLLPLSPSDILLLASNRALATSIFCSSLPLSPSYVTLAKITFKTRVCNVPVASPHTITASTVTAARSLLSVITPRPRDIILCVHPPLFSLTRL